MATEPVPLVVLPGTCTCGCDPSPRNTRMARMIPPPGPPLIFEVTAARRFPLVEAATSTISRIGSGPLGGTKRVRALPPFGEMERIELKPWKTTRVFGEGRSVAPPVAAMQSIETRDRTKAGAIHRAFMSASLCRRRDACPNRPGRARLQSAQSDAAVRSACPDRADGVPAVLRPVPAADAEREAAGVAGREREVDQEVRRVEPRDQPPRGRCDGHPHQCGRPGFAVEDAVGDRGAGVVAGSRLGNRDVLIEGRECRLRAAVAVEPPEDGVDSVRTGVEEVVVRAARTGLRAERGVAGRSSAA